MLFKRTVFKVSDSERQSEDLNVLVCKYFDIKWVWMFPFLNCMNKYANRKEKLRIIHSSGDYNQLT